MRIAVTTLLVAILGCSLACGAGSGDDGPVIDGHICGGIGGWRCPPASSCSGQCDGPDCGGACRADQPCGPSLSECPNGTVCDEALGYCMPGQACAATAECPTGQHCLTNDFVTGLCATLPETAPNTCDTEEDCPFPWFCAGPPGEATCRLACVESQCPGTMTCDRYQCVASQ